MFSPLIYFPYGAAKPHVSLCPFAYKKQVLHVSSTCFLFFRQRRGAGLFLLTFALLAILLLWLPGRARRKEAKVERERILAEMDRLRHRQRRFPQMDSNTPDKADTSHEKGSGATDTPGAAEEKRESKAAEPDAPGESRQTKAD